MAKAKKVESQIVEPSNTAAADLSFTGQLTAAATVTPTAPTVRHYGGKDEVQSAKFAKYGTTVYTASAAGAKRLATQAAKRDLDSRYACAWQIADLLLANGSVTADQYMQACEQAGCASSGALAFSKRGSTNNAYAVWSYYVAKKLLVPV